jgi:hypothetical protein
MSLSLEIFILWFVCDVGIFKINMNNNDSLALRFWMEKTKCYGLKQIIHQNNSKFINYLNQFWIVIQSQLDVNIIIINVFVHHKMIQHLNIYFIWMEHDKNTMNQLSLEVKGLYTYCVHKINIMIHLSNHFRVKSW